MGVNSFLLEKPDKGDKHFDRVSSPLKLQATVKNHQILKYMILGARRGPRSSKTNTLADLDLYCSFIV